MPVDFHRTGNVADVVEQDVLVGFDDDQAGRAQMGGQPVGSHQTFGVGVVLEHGAGISGQRHGSEPTVAWISWGLEMESGVCPFTQTACGPICCGFTGEFLGRNVAMGVCDDVVSVGAGVTARRAEAEQGDGGLLPTG